MSSVPRVGNEGTISALSTDDKGKKKRGRGKTREEDEDGNLGEVEHERRKTREEVKEEEEEPNYIGNHEDIEGGDSRLRCRKEVDEHYLTHVADSNWCPYCLRWREGSGAQEGRAAGPKDQEVHRSPLLPGATRLVPEEDESRCRCEVNESWVSAWPASCQCDEGAAMHRKVRRSGNTDRPED